MGWGRRFCRGVSGRLALARHKATQFDPPSPSPPGPCSVNLPSAALKSQLHTCRALAEFLESKARKPPKKSA